jgi:heme/copper-type cytochrome/quinol oxidase subunit 2
MRACLAWSILTVGFGVFIAMLVAMHRHRAHATAAGERRGVGEYFWALVPWLIVALCSAPAVHQMLTSG